jgi:hypothetical protein
MADAVGSDSTARFYSFSNTLSAYITISISLTAG